MRETSGGLVLAGTLLFVLLAAHGEGALGAEGLTVLRPEGASFAESLAAQEVRRYLYLRTGQLVPVAKEALPVAGPAILIARKDRPVLAALVKDEKLRAQVAELGAQEYLLKTLDDGGRRIALIIGCDDAGVLYGAYRFAEHLGVRFYLEGDVIPDARIPLELPALDERGKPLFALRGIQPFHDFPEGPDWWNADDYKTYISQLPKLGMNFFGLHTYPEDGAEPAVWIGMSEDVGPDGKVLHSYPSSWHNTLRGDWGYASRKTGDYVCGGSMLFERDDFGGDVMAGFCPRPQKPEDCNEVFDRAGVLIGEAFRHARRLSVKTCIGTETPLTIPRRVVERIQGKKKDSPVRAVGGKTVGFPENVIAGTEDGPLYQTVRFDLAGYRLTVPNGKYAVTLKFCEPAYKAKGIRVFDVKLQGKPVIEKLDIFEKVGQNKALDFTFEDVEVTNGRVEIDFVKRNEFPCIAAIAVRGGNFSLKANCGGAEYKDYLSDDGITPADVQKLYEGMFQRIMRTYPIDYYWFWTPEGWTWSGTTQGQVDTTMADIKLAIAAAKAVNAPFTLATCGWVLGPPQDRALFDKVLPREMPLSCISREVGHAPVETGFANVSAGRPRWSIPWLEDDPALNIPQLWVGRMRKDAADSLKSGCTGLMGIHWRTRILGPNLSALAKAAWDQSVWNPPEAKPVEQPRIAGPVGGNAAPFPNNPIADTQDAPLYQTVRYDMSAYRLPLPNGSYTVTLKFCEPHYKEAGKRVFGVKLQGQPVIDKLDIFAKAGQNKALDYTFKDIAVTNGWLDIDFEQQVEFPSMAAIAVEGEKATKKINCGGAAYKDYAADWPAAPPGPRPDRFAPNADFWPDWALQGFGSEAGPQAARIFQKIDDHLPRPADWVDGPGGLRPDGRPWAEASKQYAFVDELEALRPQVKGAGSLERFDYWLTNFRYMRAIAHANCLWAQFNAAMATVKAEKDPAAKKQLARDQALPIRKQLVQAVGEAYRNLLQTVSTPGEMGTVMNFENHNLPGLLIRPGDELAKILGEPLPADALLGKEYDGPPRVIVPTVRTSAARGEVLTLKVILLSSKPPREATLFWRAMGQGEFAKVPLTHLARGVYTAKFPPASAQADLEYYVEAQFDGAAAVRFPAAAPALSQSVILSPE